MTLRQLLRLLTDRENPIGRQRPGRRVAIGLLLAVAAVASLVGAANESGADAAVVIALLSLAAAPIAGLIAVLFLGRPISDEKMEELLLTPLSREEVVAGFARPMWQVYGVAFGIWLVGFLVAALTRVAKVEDSNLMPIAFLVPLFLGMVGFWVGGWSVMMDVWLLRRGWILTIIAAAAGLIYHTYVAGFAAVFLASIGRQLPGLEPFSPLRDYFAMGAVGAFLFVYPAMRLCRVMRHAAPRFFGAVDPERSAREYWYAAEVWCLADFKEALLAAFRWSPELRRAAGQSLAILFPLVAVSFYVSRGSLSRSIALAVEYPPVLIGFALLLPVLHVRALASSNPARTVPLRSGKATPDLLRIAVQQAVAMGLIAIMLFSRAPGTNSALDIVATWAACTAAALVIFIALLPVRWRKLRTAGWIVVAISAQLLLTMPNQGSTMGAVVSALAVLGAWHVGFGLEGLHRYHAERPPEAPSA